MIPPHIIKTVPPLLSWEACFATGFLFCVIEIVKVLIYNILSDFYVKILIKYEKKGAKK